jgi:hypothetical protein
MTSQSKRMHPLSALHLVAIAGLVVWWSLYFWHHTPARELLRDGSTPTGTQHRRPDRGSLEGKATLALGAGTRRAATAISVALADVAAGVLVLILFAVGTGIYVRRLEIWLQARSSGETMSFASNGLDDKTLAANPSGRRP